MSIQRLVISAFAIIASCHASGIGHLYPAVKSFPVVRYAPFFSFPTGARSIHAFARPAPLLPAPILPAPVPFHPAPAPFFPAPSPLIPAPAPFVPAPAPAPFLPAPAFPAPAYPAPAFPASAYPGPVFGPVAIPPQAPILSGAFPYIAPGLPRLAPFVPTLPRIAPVIPALPQAALYARAVPALPSTPFSPILRPVETSLAAPVFGQPGPIAVAKAQPFGIHAYAPHIPYPPAPAPVFGQAWKK